MSSVFEVEDPKNCVIGIHSDTPLSPRAKLHLMLPYFDHSRQAEGINARLIDNLPGARMEKMIEGLKLIPGIWQIEIWSLYMKIHYGKLFKPRDIMDDVATLLSDCWPGAQFKGHNWRLLSSSTELLIFETVPTYLQLAKALPPAGKAIQLEGYKARKPEEKLHLVDFKPTSVALKTIHSRPESYVYTSSRSCRLTSDPASVHYSIDRGDQLLFRSALEVNIGSGVGTLSAPKN